MSASKKSRWWMVGVALAGVVALLLTRTPEGEPFVISVAGRTNDATGERVLIVVSNRSNREFFVQPTTMVMRGGEWGLTSLEIIAEQFLPARTNCVFELGFPTDAPRLSVTYVAHRRPGRVERFLKRCAEKLGLTYAEDTPIEGTLNVDR